MQVLVRIIKFVIQLKVLLHFIVHSPQTGQRIRPHHKADSADRSNIQFSVTKTTTRVMDWANTILLIVLIILLIPINLLKILLKPLWRFLLGSRLPMIVRTPAERFEGLDKLGYEFKENYLRWETTDLYS